MSLTEKGDKRLEFIKKVTTVLRGDVPVDPRTAPPKGLPPGVGRPVNES